MTEVIDKAGISGELDIKLVRNGELIRHQKVARDKTNGKMEELVVETQAYRDSVPQ